MKRAVNSSLFSFCGITPIASPSKVIPWPENEITLTLKGFSLLSFLFLKISSNFLIILSLNLLSSILSSVIMSELWYFKSSLKNF